MRDLAIATVDAARALYPDGPHAEVFYKRFVHHNIIKVPRPEFEVNGFAALNDQGADLSILGIQSISILT